VQSIRLAKENSRQTRDVLKHGLSEDASLEHLERKKRRKKRL